MGVSATRSYNMVAIFVSSANQHLPNIFSESFTPPINVPSVSLPGSMIWASSMWCVARTSSARASSSHSWIFSRLQSGGNMSMNWITSRHFGNCPRCTLVLPWWQQAELDPSQISWCCHHAVVRWLLSQSIIYVNRVRRQGKETG